MGFLKTLFTGKEETAEEKAQEKQRNDFDMFKYDGIQALQIGQTQFAIKCLQRALDIHDDLETRHTLANAFLKNDDIEATIEQLRQLIAMQPENPRYHISLAELLYQQEQYEQATEICQKTSEQFDQLPQPHQIKAKIYQAQNQPINAVAETTIAISLQPDYTEAHMLRAELLANMGQYNEAEQDIDIVLSEDADNDQALTIKAQCCLANKRIDEAEQTFRKIIEANPFNTDAYISLGQMLISQGRNDEATELAQEALQYAPEQMQSINGQFETNT